MQQQKLASWSKPLQPVQYGLNKHLFAGDRLSNHWLPGNRVGIQATYAPPCKAKALP